jgi:hypothetical protein
MICMYLQTFCSMHGKQVHTYAQRRRLSSFCRHAYSMGNKVTPPFAAAIFNRENLFFLAFLGIFNSIIQL